MKKFFLVAVGFVALVMGSVGALAGSGGRVDQPLHDVVVVTAASPSPTAPEETGQANQTGDQGQKGESGQTNETGEHGEANQTGEQGQHGETGQATETGGTGAEG